MPSAVAVGTGVDVVCGSDAVEDLVVGSRVNCVSTLFLVLVVVLRLVRIVLA